MPGKLYNLMDDGSIDCGNSFDRDGWEYLLDLLYQGIESFGGLFAGLRSTRRWIYLNKDHMLKCFI